MIKWITFKEKKSGILTVFDSTYQRLGKRNATEQRSFEFEFKHTSFL